MLKLNRTSILAVVLAASAWLSAPTTSFARPMSYGPVAIPPECTTHAIYPYPDTTNGPAWAFLMNFESGSPDACVILFKTGARWPTAYVPIRTCTVDGSVAFAGGQATFNGGSINCGVNLHKLSREVLGEPLVSPTFYDRLLISGNGQLSAGAAGSAANNPLLYYYPAKAGETANGLSVPLIADPSQPLAQMDAYIADNWLPPSAAFPAILSGNYSYSAFYTPKQIDYWWDVGNYGSSANPLTSHTLSHPPLQFWTDGGTFAAGRGPLGSTLYGSFDELFIDPPGKGGGGTR